VAALRLRGRFEEEAHEAPLLLEVGVPFDLAGRVLLLELRDYGFRVRGVVT
jgi:hypothetical protein